MNKYVFLTALLTVLGSAAAIIDHRSQGPGPSPLRNSVRSGSISAPGIVEGAAEEIELRSEIPGTVTRILVSIGQRVKKGEPLLELDSREAKSKVAAAEARCAAARAEKERLLNGATDFERKEAKALMAAAKARLTQAEKSFARVQKLASELAVSGQEADDAKAVSNTLQAEFDAAAYRVALLEAPAREDELRLADARIAEAESAVETAKVLLDKLQLRSPGDAQILDINVEVGELISPDQLTPVIVLSDTSRLRIRAHVEELDAPRVRLEAPARITADGLEGRVYEGKVVFLSPRMAAKTRFSETPSELYDTKTREALVDVLSPGAGLIVGLRVDVLIEGE